MRIPKKINDIRRVAMRRITRRLGHSRLDTSAIQDSQKSIRRVLICRPNHRLGNQLLIMPLVTEVTNTLPHAQIDLFVKGPVAPVLFREYRNIGRIIMLPKKPARKGFQYFRGWVRIMIDRYDLVINAVDSSSSGRISAQMANARLKFLGEISDDVRSRFDDYQHIAKAPVYSFRMLMAKLGFDASDGPIPVLDLKLTSDEIAAGQDAVTDLVRNDRRTIGVYTFATGAKCYEEEWWMECYHRLKLSFPDYNIVEVLPIENVSQIGFTAPSFYSKDLRQIASLIANVDVFICADSGMMHLASAAGANVIGLFKTDNMPVYAPYNDRSSGVRTDKITMDELMNVVEGALKGSTIDGRQHTAHSNAEN